MDKRLQSSKRLFKVWLYYCAKQIVQKDLFLSPPNSFKYQVLQSFVYQSIYFRQFVENSISDCVPGSRTNQKQVL